MSRQGYARIAGWTFLLYIATGVLGMVLSGRASAGAQEPAAVLANLTAHAGLVRAGALLVFLEFLYALVLGVALHAVTRDVDPDLALLAALSRSAEGMLGAYAVVRKLDLLVIAQLSVGSDANAASARAFGSLLLKEGGANVTVAALCFAVGSAVFSYLFWRGKVVPRWLAGLGVAASVLLLVGLPLQLGGLLKAPSTMLMWVPMAAYEVTLGGWLIVKGVAPHQGGAAAAVTPTPQESL